MVAAAAFFAAVFADKSKHLRVLLQCGGRFKREKLDSDPAASWSSSLERYEMPRHDTTLSFTRSMDTRSCAFGG